MRTSLRLLGDVRANSKAVLRPMPDEAPVMRTVLPKRVFAIDVGMFACWPSLAFVLVINQE